MASSDDENETTQQKRLSVGLLFSYRYKSLPAKKEPYFFQLEMNSLSVKHDMERDRQLIDGTHEMIIVMDIIGYRVIDANMVIKLITL